MVSWPVVDGGPSAMRVQILPSCRNPLTNLSAPLTAGFFGFRCGGFRARGISYSDRLLYFPTGARLCFGPRCGGFALLSQSLFGWFGGWLPNHKANTKKKLKNRRVLYGGRSLWPPLWEFR